MTNDLNIFDAYGRIRDLSGDADVAAIEALPDDTRAKLFECIAAVKASEASDARVLAARTDVRAKDEIYSAALEAEHKANPPSTHKAALAAVIGANAGRKPEPVKVNKKTRAALAEAEMVLAEARATLTRATTEHRALVATAGTALNAWRLCCQTPSDFQVRRQYVARSTEDRAARVAAGLSAEPPRVTAHGKTEIDRVMFSRGKVSANRLPVFMGKR